MLQARELLESTLTPLLRRCAEEESTQASTCIRQHTSAYSMRLHRQHTSAYVSGRCAEEESTQASTYFKALLSLY